MRLQREARDAANRLQATRAKLAAAEQVSRQFVKIQLNCSFAEP